MYFDPAARMPTREDADFCFVTETMSSEDFKDAYPKAAMVEIDVDGETDGITEWRDGDDMISRGILLEKAG